jgi:hypothetical protein
MSATEGTTARSESASTAIPSLLGDGTTGSESVEIDALHLSLTGRWSGGNSYNIHLLQNGDLGVILQRGQDGPHSSRDPISHSLEDTGCVIVSLGVDGDHDEVHYSIGIGNGGRVDVEELLGQAIETLHTCREVSRRIRTAGGNERNAFELGRDYERGQREAAE